MLSAKIRSFFSGKPSIDPSPEITSELRKEYGRQRVLGDQPYACYAPFKNMYFGQDGKVVACCYNRDHVLGNYPAQSIKQIWQGEKANALRNHLKAYNFSLGCTGCLDQLVVGNFDGSKAKGYDAQRLNNNRLPSVMEFELDDTCNLECIMCNGEYSSLIRTKREKRPARHKLYDDNFINQLGEFIPFLEEVKFYGGEPFLIQTYFKIWDKIIAINPKVRISVQTNGTTLNSRVKEVLQKSDFHINLSIDSLQKEIYEKIRVNGHFEEVMNNIQFFSNYCKERNTFFGISVCIMKQNWFEAPDFIKFCNELDVPVYFHTVSFPVYTSLNQLTQKRLTTIYTELSTGLNELPEDTPNRKKNKKHYHDFLMQLLEWSKRRNANPETEDIETLAQLEEFVIRKTLERTDINDARKAEIKVKILTSMAEFGRLLPPDADIRQLIKDVDPRNEIQMKAFLDSVENGHINQGIEYLSLRTGEWFMGRDYLTSPGGFPI